MISPFRSSALGPNGDIHFAAKNASTHRQPGGAKGCGIGLDPCRVAANELGLEPSADREIRTCRHQLLGRSPCFLRLAGLLIGDHDIGKAKSGASRMIRIEGGNCFLDAPRQAIGISESAQIHVRAKGDRFLALYDRFFGISRRRENEAGKFRCIGRARRQLHCLPGVGHGFVVASLH